MLLLDHLHPILGSAVDTWATVFVAIGTVGAVAYALFRDLFVVPRRRPKLDLRFEHAGNDQVVVECWRSTPNMPAIGSFRPWAKYQPPLPC